ncbi:Rpn family recombination-promoting nuclease/putative transposase [Anaerobiospirillum sp. NML120449]|uniref:Rpn family recombination-promoting nuclease/putative transposase n=1 Tax=Anaerobiospirillum sp. NML120449 TaxID=2932817 RepID=UPI001FF37EC7|nr:Rpn family recombination-promoting nuclease/putative transposase [Anaerobiospirillum sp. NML120449]MCK0527203.1 Rpn family recombination-promoting nuclease/putative transposase [Anaerobiospirillum sp. NML120449]
MKTDDTICKDNASEASAPSGNTMSAEPGPAIHHDTSVSEASAAADAAAECRQDAAASASQVQKYVSIKNAVHDGKVIKYGYTADGLMGKIEIKIDYSVKPASRLSGPVSGSPHDRYAKIMFGDPHVICSIFNNFIYPALYDETGTLRPVDFRKLDKELLSKDKALFCDLLWSCDSEHNSRDIIDVEFQSSVDKNMPERIRQYIDSIKFNNQIITESLKDGRHPIVSSVLIFTGNSEWDGLYSLKFQSELAPKKRMLIFMSQPFVFISPQHYELDELLAMDSNLAAVIFALYKPLTLEKAVEVLNKAVNLIGYLPEHTKRDFTLFINYALGVAASYIKFPVYEDNPMTVQSLRDASMEAQIQWSKQQYDRGYNEAAIIVRDQVRDELRAEVRAEVRDELRAEVRDELRAEVRDEVRNEVRDEVRNEVRDEVRNEVRDEVRNEVRDEVRNEVRDEVRNEVRDEVRNEILEEIRNVVRD